MALAARLICGPFSQAVDGWGRPGLSWYLCLFYLILPSTSTIICKRSDLQHRCKSAYPFKIFDLTYSTVSRYCVKKLPPLTRLTVDQPYRNWGRIGIVGHKSMRITHTYLTKTSGRGDALAGKLAARYAERLSG